MKKDQKVRQPSFRTGAAQYSPVSTEGEQEKSA
jgi:hypothetical protein